MSSHLIYFGAKNKQTNEYVYPKVANKIDEYICPECHRDVILCQGNIVAPYFRHVKNKDSHSPCQHYEHTNEAQLHKEAKMLLEQLLTKNVPIHFTRECCCCKDNITVHHPEYTNDSNVSVEHRFIFQNKMKIADVAHIQNDELKCIYEIYNTHKTSCQDRPEPWIEISAITLLAAANQGELPLNIPCLRIQKCEKCIKKRKRDDKCEYNELTNSEPQDINYERKNIAYDHQYSRSEGGGIKCRNFQLCGTVLPKWWWECNNNYLCNNCHCQYGTWGSKKGKGVLEFQENYRCIKCTKKKYCVSYACCDHFACIDCFRLNEHHNC
jgi:hypothetical protein